MKKILLSPAHYQAALQTRLITTPAMEMGTAVHSLVLDGQKAFEGAYFDRGKEGKDLTVAELKEALDKKGMDYKKSAKKTELEDLLYPNGKPIDRRTGLSSDDYAAVQGMAESLRRLEWYAGTDAEYIKRNEVSIYWDWLGNECKARLDSVLVEEGIVLDLKTTDTVDPDLFVKKVVSLGYDFQAAYYAKAAEVAYKKKFRFIFVAVERKAPYTVDLFEVTPDMLDEGTAKCELALKRHAECQASGEWPNRDPLIRQMDYPNWYNRVKLDETPEEDIF